MIQELGLDIIFWWKNVDWEGGSGLRFLPESTSYMCPKHPTPPYTYIYATSQLYRPPIFPTHDTASPLISLFLTLGRAALPSCTSIYLTCMCIHYLKELINIIYLTYMYIHYLPELINIICPTYMCIYYLPELINIICPTYMCIHYLPELINIIDRFFIHK
jgi:hypothetical protein